MKQPTEGAICCQYFKWFCLQYPKYKRLLHHSPNEGRRDARTGRYVKLMGMQPGWPDYTLAVPSGTFPGMFLEMKRPSESNRKLPEHQLSMLKLLSEMGYYVAVTYDAREAIDITQCYLNSPDKLPEPAFLQPRTEKCSAIKEKTI